jgi:hypothetical protein
VLELGVVLMLLYAASLVLMLACGLLVLVRRLS